MTSHPKTDGETSRSVPLAHRLRPATLAEFVGQERMIGPGTALRTSIEEDTLSSIILSGPPGTGKTTLAHVIAETTKAQFVRINAVLSGVKEIKEVCADAERRFTALKQRTVLFIDEIHRFNKAQQDALLPYVESGAVILIGATTENPYFEVNKALVSRSHVYMLQPHSEDEILQILQRALEAPEGLGGKVKVQDEALKRIAKIANGDARVALNALELAAVTAGGEVTLAQAEALFKQRNKRYDRVGEDHYDTISAFIKTLRGSDVDAALIWLYKMLDSGEEPRFLFRRMAIFASEDIGNADPRALQFVVSAWQAFEYVGLPEGEYFLSHACIYLAQAPKSGAVKNAMGAARKAIEQAPSLEVPYHIRNAPVKAMKEHGYGKGYLYPHDDPRGVVPGSYFPIGMQAIDLYQPTEHGEEREIGERVRKNRNITRGKT